jgi:PilZ domain
MEQRAEPRRAYFAQIRLEFETDDGSSCSMAGLMEDRSKSGFGVRLTKPLPVGLNVTITHGGQTFRCEVKRCVPNGSEYLIGVRILPSEAAD